MACRFTYNGKVYDQDGLALALRDMSPSEASRWNTTIPNIPDAPFVSKTSDWSSLALKRMVRYAAENGYDSISWTTGDVQAERYDLSKSISRVVYQSNAKRLQAFDKSGKSVIDQSGVEPDALPDFIGKEAAQKLIDTEPNNVGVHQLDGADLKVGGEGMKGFYDKILVDAANKLGKKFGAKVGQADIGADQKWGLKDSHGWAIGDRFNSEAEAEAYRTRHSSLHDTRVVADGALSAHSLPITQAMRDSVMQGQPLFQETNKPGAPDQVTQFTDALSPKQRASLAATVIADAHRILGHRFNIKPVDRILDNNGNPTTLQGQYDPNDRTVYIALQAATSARGTTGHEAIHALRDIGAITKPEWEVLKAGVNQYESVSNGVTKSLHENTKYNYEAGYRARMDITERELQDLLHEESVAAMFNVFIDDKLTGRVDRRVLRILRKLKLFLEAVRNAMRGHGFITSEGVMEHIWAGGMRDRKGTEGPGRGYALNRKDSSLPTFTGRLDSRRIVPPPRNPNQGSFEIPHDERVLDAIRDSTDTMLNRIRRGGKSALVQFRRKMQDREVDLKRTQAAIKDAGRSIPETTDAYLAASLYPGRVAQQDADLVTDIVKPLIEDIHRRGLTLDEVDLFNKARHAFERNIALGQKRPAGHQFHEAMTNPAIVGASGFSDNQAAQILDGINTSGKYKNLEEVGNKILEINKATRDLQLSSGLITQEQHDAMEKQYKYYVPLRGYDDPINPNTMDSPRVGKRYDIRGNEIRQAFGRTSQADSSTAYSIMQAREALVRAEKNRVGKRFLLLAQANPNLAMWEINRRDLKQVVDQSSGLIKEVADQSIQNAENDYAVKVGGKTYHITIHHEGLLRAMKGLGGENMGDLVTSFSKIMRFIAGTRTSFDPEFIFRNLIKDAQEGSVNLQEEGVRALATKVVSGIPSAIVGMNQMLLGDTSTPMAKAAREFADAGGKIGFMNRGDIEKEKADLQKMMSEMDPSLIQSGWMAVRDQLLHRIERWNDSIENGIRLSAYVNLRKAGYTADRAAYAARELTVNFNRKGEWSPAVNAFYMFANARVQGTANMIGRLHRSPKIRKIATGILAGAVLQGLFNHWMAGDDDDDKNRYDKIPDFVKQHQFILMLSKDMEAKTGMPYLHFPLPPGYGMFHTIGTQIAEMLTGSRKPVEAAGNMVSSVQNAFNPLDSSSGIVGDFIPTLLSPFYDMATNTNYFGEKIVPDDPSKKKPMSERYKYNVSPATKVIAQGANSLTGGNSVRPGLVDVSPNQVQYLWDFITGGIGTMVSRTSTVISNVAHGDPVEPSQIPFVRVFAGQGSKYADRDAYYKIQTDIQTAKDEIKLYQGKHDAEGIAQVKQDYARDLSLQGMAHDVDLTIGRLSKQQKVLDNNPNLPEVERKARIKAIQDRKDELMTKVRKAWNDWNPKP